MAPSDTVTSSQVNAALTAVPVSAAGDSDAVAIKAHPSNVGVVWIGGAGVTDTTGYPLSASEGVSMDILNVNKIFVYGAATDKVCLLKGF